MTASGWRKSSYSAGQGECVEVARVPVEARVRDTKDRRSGLLSFGAAEWQVFIQGVKAGESD